MSIHKNILFTQKGEPMDFNYVNNKQAANITTSKSSSKLNKANQQNGSLFDFSSSGVCSYSNTNTYNGGNLFGYSNTNSASAKKSSGVSLTSKSSNSTKATKITNSSGLIKQKESLLEEKSQLEAEKRNLDSLSASLASAKANLNTLEETQFSKNNSSKATSSKISIAKKANRSSFSNSFAKYSQNYNPQKSAYENQLANYNSQLSVYNSKVAAYNSKVAEFEQNGGSGVNKLSTIAKKASTSTSNKSASAPTAVKISNSTQSAALNNKTEQVKSKPKKENMTWQERIDYMMTEKEPELSEIASFDKLDEVVSTMQKYIDSKYKGKIPLGVNQNTFGSGLGYHEITLIRKDA